MTLGCFHNSILNVWIADGVKCTISTLTALQCWLSVFLLVHRLAGHVDIEPRPKTHLVELGTVPVGHQHF